MKKFLIKYRSLTLLFLTVTITIFNFSIQFANAESALQTYINQASAQQCSDAALKDLFGQTGYKVASQSDIDAIRNKATLEQPSLVSKYPLIFGGCADSFLDPNQTYTDEQIAQFNETGFESIARISSNVGSDLRSWINAYIDSMANTPISVPYGSDIWGHNTSTYFDPSISDTSVGHWDALPYKSYISLLSSDGSVLWATQVLYPYVSYDFYVVGGVDIQVRKKRTDGIIDTSGMNRVKGGSYTIHCDGTKIINTKDNYIPYPTSSADLSVGETVPTSISMPVSVGTDGVITPQIQPLTFPSTQIQPNSDGLVDTGSATVTYTEPTIDPTTGQIIDPVTVTDPTTDPSTDPSTGTSSDTITKGIEDTLEVPDNDVPTLDFGPLKVATQKFPFCIPWDIADTVKLLKADAESPKFTITEIKLGTMVLIPEYTWDLADIPRVAEIIAIFRWFEVLCFLFFLYLNSRDKFIRG